jgi:hypothetical protein
MAQTPSKPAPDVITFTNGDKLSGHFVRSTAANVTFHSDAVGDITVEWKNVTQLETNTKVALIRKGVQLKHRSDSASIPQGILAMNDQKLTLTSTPGVDQGAASQPIPVAEAAIVIDQPAFQKAITHNPNLLQDWKGSFTLGAALVAATQDSESFNGALNLVRAVPAEDWLDPRDRTIFNFSTSYGEIKQSGTPTVRTSIYHLDTERDEYVSRKFFVFASAAFDHNFSQGLELQQTYSGGAGITVVSAASQTLDLKASASYLRQQFNKAPEQSLAGSVFAEHYNRKFFHGIIADQHLTFTPAWSNTRDWSGSFSTVFTMPVYKRLNASTSLIDSFLNDPPPGFRKNSLQLSLGATWALQ